MESGRLLLGNKQEGLKLKKNGVTWAFNIKIETRSGVVWAACLKRLDTKIGAPAA